MIQEGYCAVEIKLTTNEGSIEFKETIDEVASCCSCGGHCDIKTAFIYSDMNVNMRKGRITHFICSDCIKDDSDYAVGGTE